MAIPPAAVSSEMKFARPESADRAFARKIWYVRTASVRFGLAEYAKAIVDFENSETAKVTIFVATIPFLDMIPFYVDRPIKIEPNSHPYLLLASTTCEKMDKVIKVAVRVFLPCSISQCCSIYGVSELCSKAFPNIDVEQSSIFAIHGQQRWNCNKAFRPRTIASHSLSPALILTQLKSQRNRD